MRDVSGSGGGLHPFDGFYVLDVWRRVGPQFFQVLEAVWMLQIAHPCRCKPPEAPPCNRSAPGRVAARCSRLCKCVPCPTLRAVVASSRKTGQPMPTGGRTAMPTSPRCCHCFRSGCGRAFSQVVGQCARRGQDAQRTGAAGMRRCRVSHVTPISVSGRSSPAALALVVNPGGGAAAPRASWLQPCGPNNFPTAAQFPREANSLGLRVLHCVAASSLRLAALRDAARPTPTGRITDKAAVGDLAPPETE
jgi:hypothetical protein